MYVIIAGGGVVGYYTAQFLNKADHDVVVIEEDKARAEELSEKLEAVVVNGNASEIKTLQEAGVENTDVLLALTGSDESNILISILGKQLGAKRVLTRITHIEYSEDIFKKLGIDSVIYPELAIATQIEEMVRDPDITGFAMLDKGDIDVVEFRIDQKSKLIGKAVDSVKLPDKSKIVSLVRGGKIEVFKPGLKIQPGDNVLVLTNNKEIQKVEQIFSK
ncbi:MAG: NAD-binding protein [Candidatus Altiarchaeota archaeon]|nr:NAD-binding protein [Candidatus Altiarchaeota archaeon]